MYKLNKLFRNYVKDKYRRIIKLLIIENVLFFLGSIR